MHRQLQIRSDVMCTQTRTRELYFFFATVFCRSGRHEKEPLSSILQVGIPHALAESHQMSSVYVCVEGGGGARTSSVLRGKYVAVFIEGRYGIVLQFKRFNLRVGQSPTIWLSQLEPAPALFGQASLDM